MPEETHIHKWKLIRSHRGDEILELHNEIEVLSPEDDDPSPAKLTDLKDRDIRDVWLTTIGAKAESFEVTEQHLECDEPGCAARIPEGNIQDVSDLPPSSDMSIINLIATDMNIGPDELRMSLNRSANRIRTLLTTMNVDADAEHDWIAAGLLLSYVVLEMN